MTLTREKSLGRRGVRLVAVATSLLLLVVLASVLRRLVSDGPHLAAGTSPADTFDQRYVAHPWLAYLHILPGALYLFLAPLQLAYWFRHRHYPVHRRVGRVLATAGIVTGLFAVIFGGRLAFGGLAEASAAVVFGLWFLTCLVFAVRAIRTHDIVNHRRWMIRAFATAVGVGTVRVWLSVFAFTGWLDMVSSFGPALLARLRGQCAGR
jgi:uncharacterized membrane protein